MKTLYVAAPLFSAAERAFNEKLKAALTPVLNVFLPQQDGMLIVDLLRTGASFDEAARAVFACDVNAVSKSDGLLIVLDGRAVDEGAAFELGLAYALKKTCVALQTDPRRLFAIGNSPMMTGAVSAVLTDLDELITWARQWSAVP